MAQNIKDNSRFGVIIFAVVLGFAIISAYLGQARKLALYDVTNPEFKSYGETLREQIAGKPNLNSFNNPNDVLAQQAVSASSCDADSVLFLGDSITNGQAQSLAVPAAYNLARDGASTFWVVAGGSDSNLRNVMLETLRNTDAWAIVMMFGTNDCGNANLATGFRNNLSSLVDDIKRENPNIKIFMSTIPRRSGSFRVQCGNFNNLVRNAGESDQDWSDRLTQSWNGIIREVAAQKNVGLRDAYAAMSIDLFQGGSDGIHPSSFSSLNAATNTLLGAQGSSACSSSGNTPQVTSVPTTSSGGGVCDKFGVNLLTPPTHPADYSRASSLGLKYVLEVSQSADGTQAIIDGINLFDGTSVVRFCDANTEDGGLDPDCGFRTTVTGNSRNSGVAAAEVIINVAKAVDERFVAAPVNEPNAEYWAGSSPGDIAVFYQAFIDRIEREGADVRSKIVIASPTFNVRAGDGSFDRYLNAFLPLADKIDIWTANFYDNVPGQGDFNLVNTLEYIKGKFPGDKPIGINEMGDFSKNLPVLKEHLTVLAEDERVSYAIFFNAFGQDTARWPNLILTDDEIRFLLSDFPGCSIEPLPTPLPETLAKQIDPETAEYLNAPANWNLQSCDVTSVSNGKESPEGAVFAGLDLNLCTEPENKNDTNTLPARYECANKDQDHWTAGYGYTGGIHDFPLINFLAASEETDDNNFTPDCRLDSFRNFTTGNTLYDLPGGGKAPFLLNFTNEFPGLSRFISSDEQRVFNIKTPLLGGAGACGIVNYNYPYEDAETDPFLIHPLSFGERHHSGGESVSGAEQDSLLSRILLIFKNLFNQGAIPTNETTVNLCQDLPGGAITKINTSDIRRFPFTDDPAPEGPGPFEYALGVNNFELTEEEVCDLQFKGSPNVNNKGESLREVKGAICKLDRDGPTFRGDKGDSIKTAGIISGPCTTFNPITRVETINRFDFCGSTGRPYTCSTSQQSLYEACRGGGYEVDNVTGNPFLKFERGGFPKTDMKALAKYIYNLWFYESITTPYKIIHNVNAGIDTKWRINLYDLQLEPKGQQITDPGLVGAVDAYNAAVLTPGGDFDINQVPRHILKSNISSLVQPYLQVWKGGYSKAKVDEGGDPNGASSVDLSYYYPWIGQAPRMLERITYFLSNENDPDTFAPFVGKVNQINSGVKDVLIDFCFEQLGNNPKLDDTSRKRPCPDGAEKCDCFVRNPDSVPDPLETWLFAARSNTAQTSGAGFSYPFTPGSGSENQCVPIQPTPGPTQPPTPGKCTEDTLSGGLATPIDSPYLSTYAGHVGLDMVAGGGSLGKPVYAVGAGEVVFVRNMIINDSRYFDGDKTKGNCRESGTCDWNSIADVIDQYNGWWKQYGNVIGIKHGDAVTVYAHLKNGSIRVKEGDCVRRNEQIAEMGNTGNSENAHLHFEVRKLACTRYIASCAYNNNPAKESAYANPYGMSTALSTPRVATDEPIPPGSGPGGTLPICSPTPTPFACPTGTTGGTPPAGKFEDLLKKAANFLNSQEGGSRVRWEASWAIFYNEVHQRCVPNHRVWATTLDENRIRPAIFSGTVPGSTVYLYKDKCTDDPNALTLYQDTQEQDGLGKGLGQQLPNHMLGVVRNNRELMEACTEHLGVNRSIGQENSSDPGGAFYDGETDQQVKAYYKQTFSRYRVGDVVCASLIYISDQVKNRFGNGSYVAAEAWTDDIARTAIGTWYTPGAPCTYSSTASSYCDRGLARYRFAASGADIPSQCSVSVSPTGGASPTPSTYPTISGGACPLNKQVSQWRNGPSHSLCEYRTYYKDVGWIAVDIPGNSSDTVKAPVTGTYQLIAPWDNPYDQCNGAGTPYDGGWVAVTQVNGLTYRLVHLKPPAGADQNSRSLGEIQAGQPLGMLLFDGNAGSRNGVNYNPTYRGCWGKQHLHFSIQGNDATAFVKQYCSNAGTETSPASWTPPSDNQCCTGAGACNNSY